MQVKVASTKKRISVAIEGSYVGHIRNCLCHLDCEDFTVSPVISGWGVRGYWSSECGGFDRIGEQVMVRFTTDLEPIQLLLNSGFGILASKVLKIQVSDDRA